MRAISIYRYISAVTEILEEYVEKLSVVPVESVGTFSQLGFIYYFLVLIYKTSPAFLNTITSYFTKRSKNVVIKLWIGNGSQIPDRFQCSFLIAKS